MVNIGRCANHTDSLCMNTTCVNTDCPLFAALGYGRVKDNSNKVKYRMEYRMYKNSGWADDWKPLPMYLNIASGGAVEFRCVIEPLADVTFFRFDGPVVS